MKEEFQIGVYETDAGKIPYEEWEDSLSSQDRALVETRLARIRKGNLGDCEPLKGKGTKGIYEIRMHFGPGYRIYYGMVGRQILLLLCGGDKGSQNRDIQKAIKFWHDYMLKNN